MRIAVIINPISGAGASADCGRARAALATRLGGELGSDLEVIITERRGHAHEIAHRARAAGAALVCAWGGDGTVNEVASALAFSDCDLGIVPAGSGNGLARELGISGPPERVLRGIWSAPARRIDAGELGGRFFFNVAGIGFDAIVADRFNARARGQRGLLPYVSTAFRALARYEPAMYSLSSGGEEIRTRALFLALANGRQYGNGALIAPSARCDDGLLDLVVVEDRSLLRVARDVRRLFTGKIHRSAGVTIRRTAYVSVSSPTPMTFHVDGEAGDEHPLALVGRVHAAALRVRIPI